MLDEVRTVKMVLTFCIPIIEFIPTTIYLISGAPRTRKSILEFQAQVSI